MAKITKMRGLIKGKAQRDDYCIVCGYPFDDYDDILIYDYDRIVCSVTCAKQLKK